MDQYLCEGENLVGVEQPDGVFKLSGDCSMQVEPGDAKSSGNRGLKSLRIAYKSAISPYKKI